MYNDKKERNSHIVQVRHGPGLYSCRMRLETMENGNQQVAVIQLSEDDQGLAAGQFTAFYDDNICLGSAIILDSWGDLYFPVCSKAMEIARTKDRSELGNPVRILNLGSDSKGSLKSKEQSAGLLSVSS